MTWKSSSHAVYDCKYHLIWCPKRRHKIGEAEIREYVDGVLRRVAQEFGFEIEEMLVGEDHVHILIEFPPKYSISKVVGILKSISASRTFKQFEWLRERFWTGELWEDGYGVRTAGDRVTADIIKRYIRRHEAEATNQPELF